MEGFTYNNIFDTKGIEYIIVIVFLLLLIPFWIILNKKGKLIGKFHPALGVITAQALRIPQGMFLSRNHTWAYLERSGLARVGLDDLLLHLTGEVKFVSLKAPGESIRKGDVLAEIEQQGKILKVYSPVSGTIMQSNPLLFSDPGQLNADPYRNGWIYSLTPNNWKAETGGFYLAGEASQWLRKELERFKDFITVEQSRYSTAPSMVVLQDGGELQDHTLETMPRECWQDFQKEFLDPGESLG